ncbi:helix-turn-helix domain-containing protein [Paractinoplanes lichenicola]|uniref:Helix-turn-helix transcriptional regulator n=1 Tax=Paractinoplanes lichenicola TaxID=2802976 RepID=A0ABS1VM16_9ACTN|nr:AraC family transcriptional regulator [Actinoplanes lichenicola]MBL7255767.1 helix-turn-helix transcriptional regulator [Actinoplanes lichenicola]
MLSTTLHAGQPYATSTFDSWERGWRSLLLRRWTHAAEADDVTVPATGEQMVAVMVSGRRRVRIGARTAVLSAGDVSMTPPGQSSRLSWRTEGPEPSAMLQLHLPSEITERLAAELGAVHRPDALRAADPLVAETIRTLERAARDGAPDLYAASAAEFLAVHLLTRTVPAPPRHEDARVRLLKDYLHAALERDVSLADMAREARMSRYHLIRVFTAAEGITPYRYLMRLRVERGRRLLTSTTLPVGVIARRCGFSDQAHFARVFRRATGVAPTEYRAAN